MLKAQFVKPICSILKRNIIKDDACYLFEFYVLQIFYSVCLINNAPFSARVQQVMKSTKHKVFKPQRYKNNNAICIFQLSDRFVLYYVIVTGNKTIIHETHLNRNVHSIKPESHKYYIYFRRIILLYFNKGRFIYILRQFLFIVEVLLFEVMSSSMIQQITSEISHLTIKVYDMNILMLSINKVEYRRKLTIY